MKAIPNPEVSVIIVTNNLADKTVSCIKSVRATCSIPHEVLWVDNGSRESDFRAMRRAFTRPRMRTKLIRFKDNRGFVQGVNAAIPEIHKSTKYIILLNNDTEVGPKTFSKLVRPLTDKKIGAAGPITQSRISWQEAVNLNRRWPNLNVPIFDGNVEKYSRQLEDKFGGKGIELSSKINLAFFCTAFRKEVFVDELQGLETAFGIGLGDDDFACHKLRVLGYKLYLVLDAFVFHHHRSTFNELKLSTDSIRRHNVKVLNRKIAELENKI